MESERLHCDRSGHMQLSLVKLSLVTLKSVLLCKDKTETIRKKLNIYSMSRGESTCALNIVLI